MIQEPNISLLVYVAADLKLCSSKKGVSPDDGDGGSPRVTVVVAVIVAVTVAVAVEVVASTAVGLGQDR